MTATEGGLMTKLENGGLRCWSASWWSCGLILLAIALTPLSAYKIM
jgi:hypothetical protein